MRRVLVELIVLTDSERDAHCMVENVMSQAMPEPDDGIDRWQVVFNGAADDNAIKGVALVNDWRR